MDDFDEFFAANYQRVVGSLMLACGTTTEAEDAAQEAFAKAMLRWRSVAQMQRPATWVYVVAVRELRRRLRRTAATFEGPDDLDQHDDDAATDVAEMVVNAAVVTAALAALPSRQRLAVVLRFHGDLSVKDIARAMSCSEGTVKASLHVALGRLRVRLVDRDLDFEGANDGA
jgi:RNA polymerase sigma-70 factor (ECF subfamily)